ncbi:MAG TPA: TetR/AcrR family transcriptional regulator [Terriglobales bacterium]|nr:TetR/AcrR family transcriptional regulator [Terriglobales bacterium]
MSSTKARAIAATGRPRDDAAQHAILQATAELLEEVGFDKLTIEGIAARAGVAKTTIYRWWQNKGTLALDAFLTAVSPKLAFAETDAPLADLRAQVHRVGKLYRGKTGRVLCEIIALAQADPTTREQLLEGYVLPRRLAAKACLERAVVQGALRPDIDIDTVLDAIYGPIWYRMILQHQPIEAHFIDGLLDLALQGIARPAKR